MKTASILNRLDESNGIVENALGMNAKKTPWFLRFATKAKGIVSFVQNLLSPLTPKEGVRGGQLSAFFQPAAAAVVGIGLLVGSLFLLAEPVGTGRGGNNPPIANVCAPTVEAIWITEDQHLHQFTVEVTLSSTGWDQFAPFFRLGECFYALLGSGWWYNDSGVPYWVDYRYSANSSNVLRSERRRQIANRVLYPSVYLDLPSSSSSDYSFEIEPALGGRNELVHFRGKHYYVWNHWIDVYLNLGDLHPITGKPLTGVTPYRGACLDSAAWTQQGVGLLCSRSLSAIIEFRMGDAWELLS